MQQHASGDARFVQRRAREAVIHPGPPEWQRLRESTMPRNWWERWCWPEMSQQEAINLLTRLGQYLISGRLAVAAKPYEYLLLRGLRPRQPIMHDELHPYRMARQRQITRSNIHIPDNPAVVVYRRSRRQLDPESRTIFSMGADNVIQIDMPVHQLPEHVGRYAVRHAVFGIDGGLIAETRIVPHWWDDVDASRARIRLHPLPGTV